MGNSLTIPYVAGESNVLAVIIDESGQYWSTAGTPALEAYNASNIADYGIATVEDGATGNYRFTIPATLPAGGYTVQAVNSATGTLTEAEVASRVGNGNIDWDGVSLTPVVYYPKVNYIRDKTTDEYTVVWYRGDEPLTSGVSSPTIKVVNRDGFSTRFGPTAMTQDGSTGVCTYDAAGAEQLAVNESGIVYLTATIDEESITRYVIVGADQPEDVYHADISVNIDDTNEQDEYTFHWYKNGDPILSGITVPTLQVTKRADGSDLLDGGTATPSQIGSTGVYKHDETVGRLDEGESGIAILTATIDGGSQTWRFTVGRDDR